MECGGHKVWPGLSTLCWVESAYRIPPQTYAHRLGRILCNRVEPELSWSGQEVWLSCDYQAQSQSPCCLCLQLWPRTAVRRSAVSLLLIYGQVAITLSTLTAPGCLGKICIPQQSAQDVEGWRRKCGSISVLLFLPSLIFRKSLFLTPLFLCFFLFFLTPFYVTWEHENSRYFFFPSGPTNENRAYYDVFLLTKSSQYNEYFLWNLRLNMGTVVDITMLLHLSGPSPRGWGLGCQSLGLSGWLHWKGGYPRLVPWHPYMSPSVFPNHLLRMYLK